MDLFSYVDLVSIFDCYPKGVNLLVNRLWTGNVWEELSEVDNGYYYFFCLFYTCLLIVSLVLLV